MTKDETIAKVMRSTNSINVDEVNFAVSNFIVFDNDYNRMFNVSEAVMKAIAMEMALEHHTNENAPKHFDSKPDMVNNIIHTGLKLSLRTKLEHPEMNQLFEIKLRKKVEINNDLVNKILDIDEINEVNKGNIHLINQKYNMNFGEISYWIYLHCLNMDTEESEFYSSELIKGNNGEYSAHGYNRDFTASGVFQTSIRRDQVAKKMMSKLKKDMDNDPMMKALKEGNGVEGLLKLLSELKKMMKDDNKD